MPQLQLNRNTFVLSDQSRYTAVERSTVLGSTV